ncbi:MAG: hypothetical protein V7L23_33415 [Nostoc sp.]|uniref:hypothetical protein n=1 Tax=Nostoc sp. TaxID=1180 RepID=UPI002FEE6D3B
MKRQNGDFDEWIKVPATQQNTDSAALVESTAHMMSSTFLSLYSAFGATRCKMLLSRSDFS